MKKERIFAHYQFDIRILSIGEKVGRSLERGFPEIVKNKRARAGKEGRAVVEGDNKSINPIQ